MTLNMNTVKCVYVCVCVHENGRADVLMNLLADIYNEINMLLVRQLAAAAAGVFMCLNKP